MTYSAAVLADSPLFYLRLGETSGTTAADSSGNGRNGSYVNTPTLGAAGLLVSDADKAVTLNGTDEYVSVPNHASFGVDTVTFEALVQTSDADGVLISHAGSANADKGSHLAVSGGKATFIIFDAAGTGYTATSARSVNDNQKHHIAGSFNGTTIRVYVDGVLDGSTPRTQATLPHSSQPVLVGARPNGPTTFLAGTVDEAAIYSGALPAARVLVHYNASIAAVPLTGSTTLTTSTPAADLDIAVVLTGTTTLTSSTPAATLAVAVPLAGWTADLSQAAHLTTSTIAVLDVEPATVAPPAGHAPIRRYSETYPIPSAYSATGRPIGWEPASVVSEDLGRYQVVIGGRDVTFYRGVETLVGDWGGAEPFGDATATFTFPQVGPHEKAGAGALSWLAEHANVRLRLVLADGAVATVNGVTYTGGVAGQDRIALFEGILPAREHWAEADDGGLVIEAVGTLFQLDYYKQPPPINDDTVRDIGRVIADAINARTRIGYRGAGVRRVTTGITTRPKGAWDPLLTGHIQDLLATAMTAGGGQWTVALERPRRAVVRLKDRTTAHWSVSAGARGVRHRLRRDGALGKDVIYGSGTDLANCRWSNTKYPHLHPDTAPIYPHDPGDVFTPGGALTGFAPFAALLDRSGYPMTSGDTYLAADEDSVRAFQTAADILVDGIVGPQTWAAAFQPGSNEGDLTGAYFAPLAADQRVMPDLYNAQGGITGPNPAWEPHRIRRETFEQFGERISKAEAVRSAKLELARDQDTGIIGEITLDADPEEGSKLLIREGHNIRLRFFEGSGLAGVLLHIAHVRHVDNGRRVVLTVDSEARDLMTVAAILARNRETRDPAGRQKPVYRNSRHVEDRAAVFDCENGSGVIPKTAVYGGLWTVLHLPVAKVGTIARSVFTTSGPAAEFSIGVFDHPVTSGQLHRAIRNPLAGVGDDGHNPWDDLTDGTGLNPVMAWGGPSEALGYDPHPKLAPDGSTNPVTGKFTDDAPWTYESQQPPWLWVAIYSATSCFVEGRLLPGPAL